MALIGYARVSTIAQDLTIQIEQLKAAGCEKIFEGKNSGKKESNTARLKDLLSYIREGDTVIVTKIDRLGRSLVQVLSVLDELRGHCCKVSDEAAFCLIQRPYISKTLLTRRISPRGSP